MVSALCSHARASRTALALLLLFPAISHAQRPPRAAPTRRETAEDRTARAFDAVRESPPELRAFLDRMPKGADLHNHLSGAIYAESWIRAAAEDGLCVDPIALSFRPAAGPAQTRTESGSPQAPGDTSPPPNCAEHDLPAARAYADQHLYDALIDAFSMRDFIPSAAASGHDHFFDTFGKFGGTSRSHMGEWLDEVAARAAAQSEQYLELMDTPPFPRTAALAKQIVWRDDFAQLRAALFAGGLRDDVAVARGELDQAESLRRDREHCGQSGEVPACQVQIRYLYQVLRGAPRETVFAQTLLGFEVASADPRVVGINFVQPEDGQISMADYALHMRTVGFFHGLYPKVHITLHAGELAPGMVPPEGLCCHIRLAVEQGHAERIGHGVDVMYEERPYELLKEMARRRTMVEISLTSNDVILGVSGKNHPFPVYRKFGVPVALSTDDEGVSRIDLTHEFVRATQTYALRYADIKQLARTSLEHSFLPGASLWRDPDAFSRPTAACSEHEPDFANPSSKCAGFLHASEKARQEWELERRFHAFESGF